MFLKPCNCAAKCILVPQLEIHYYALLYYVIIAYLMRVIKLCNIANFFQN